MYPEYTQCMEQRGALAADFLAALAEHPELPEKKAWRALRDVWKFPTTEPENAQHAARFGGMGTEVTAVLCGVGRTSSEQGLAGSRGGA